MRHNLWFWSRFQARASVVYPTCIAAPFREAVSHAGMIVGHRRQGGQASSWSLQNAQSSSSAATRPGPISREACVESPPLMQQMQRYFVVLLGTSGSEKGKQTCLTKMTLYNSHDVGVVAACHADGLHGRLARCTRGRPATEKKKGYVTMDRLTLARCDLCGSERHVRVRWLAGGTASSSTAVAIVTDVSRFFSWRRSARASD